MARKRLPLTEVLLPNGERVKTDTPVTMGLKRTIIQQFLSPGLRGMDIFYGFSREEREIAQSFDVKKAIREALESQRKSPK